jgi:monoamine oxidase
MAAHKSMDCDVVIIGAGVAGLSAAQALRAQDLTVTLLEAGHRAGGRTLTVPSPGAQGAPVDMGASWLHMARLNPFVKLAQNAGLHMRPFAPQERAPAGNQHGREAAEALFHAALSAPPRGPDMPVPDMPVMELLRRSGAENLWFPTLANLEGSIISAADFDDLGVADWKQNELDDDNLWLQGGIGSFIAGPIAAAAGPVQLDWAADTIDWNAPGGGVLVSGPRGALRGRDSRKKDSSFLRKRSKKLLSVGARVSKALTKTRKSFLVLFFKKELLSSFR